MEFLHSVMFRVLLPKKKSQPILLLGIDLYPNLRISKNLLFCSIFETLSSQNAMRTFELDF